MATSVTAAGGPAAPPRLAVAAKVGAGLFALWGVLHVWVGYEGTRLYLASPA